MAFFSGAKRRQFERETRALFKSLCHAAYRMTRDPVSAEDLTQDTLIRAYQNYDSFAQGTNFRGWLLTIMTRIYLNDCAKKRVRPMETPLYAAGEESGAWDFPSQDASSDPQAALMTGILPEHLEAALDALPIDFRVVTILIDMEDMSYQEAADALEIPVGTVRSRVSRSRMMMRRYLENKQKMPLH